MISKEYKYIIQINVWSNRWQLIGCNFIFLWDSYPSHTSRILKIIYQHLSTLKNKRNYECW